MRGRGEGEGGGKKGRIQRRGEGRREESTMTTKSMVEYGRVWQKGDE